MQQNEGGDSGKVGSLSNMKLGQDLVSNTDCWMQGAAQGGQSGIGGGGSP